MRAFNHALPVFLFCRPKGGFARAASATFRRP
jgi:hypothetical protein